MVYSQGWSDHMACEECDRCRELGYKFCIRCGQSFAEEPKVPEQPAQKEEGLFKESVLRQLVLPSMIIIFIGMLVSIVVMLLDFNAVLSYMETETVDLWVWFAGMIRFCTLTGSGSQVYFVFLAVVAIACVLLVLWDSREFFKPGEGYFDRTDKTPLFWCGLLIGSTLALELLITGFFSLIGMGIETPGGLLDLTLEKALYLFTEAAVWEELAFRVLLFGLPVAIVGLACREKGALKCLLGGFGPSKLAIAFLIFSSVLFAFAHVDSWGVGKFFTVILGGFMMGYVFMRFGLHAAILCHLINDFTLVWTLGIGEIFAGLMILGIVGFGVLNLPLLFKKTYKGLKKVKGLPLTSFYVAAVDVPVAEDTPVETPAEPQEEVQETRLMEIEDQDDSQGPKTD